MRLKKPEREAVRLKFEGLCAYCGKPLGDRWHADHFEPVRRKWWEKEGGMERPENDTLANLMPACAPCNIDKHAMPLEDWRRKLQDAAGVLARNHATYRHAVRFGLVQETGAQVVFHFERLKTPNFFVWRQTPVSRKTPVASNKQGEQLLSACRC